MANVAANKSFSRKSKTVVCDDVPKESRIDQQLVPLVGTHGWQKWQLRHLRAFNVILQREAEVRACWLFLHLNRCPEAWESVPFLYNIISLLPFNIVCFNSYHTSYKDQIYCLSSGSVLIINENTCEIIDIYLSCVILGEKKASLFFLVFFDFSGACLRVPSSSTKIALFSSLTFRWVLSSQMNRFSWFTKLTRFSLFFPNGFHSFLARF